MSNDEKSYIIKPRDVGDIVRTADKDGLTELFERPVGAIVESVTGWLAAGPKVWALATGRIVQGALKGKLFQQVAAEISELQAKGKIAEDFADRKYGFKTWVELFTVIDEETPDEDRLEALKAMFYMTNRINAADSEQIVAYQLFQIARTLSSNELQVLRTVFEMYRKGRASEINSMGYVLVYCDALSGCEVLSWAIRGACMIGDMPKNRNEIDTALREIEFQGCRLGAFWHEVGITLLDAQALSWRS